MIQFLGATKGVQSAPALDTTGADLLFITVGLGVAQVGSCSVSDSYGNTWVKLDDCVNPSSNSTTVSFYCTSPIVGAGHTVSDNASYSLMVFAAFSGINDQAPTAHNPTQAAGVSDTSQTTGSVTPVDAGSLVIAAIGFGGDSGTLLPPSDGFINIEGAPAIPSVAYGGESAYLIQSSIPTSCTFSWTTANNNCGSTITVFSPSSGGGPVTHDSVGDVVGDPFATVTGDAMWESSAVEHETSGALTGQFGTVIGMARRNVKHPTTGALTGRTAEVDGFGSHEEAAGMHDASGNVIGNRGVVTGTAKHIIEHRATGAVTGRSSQTTGAANRQGTHEAVGVLLGGTGKVTGVAQGPIAERTLTQADIDWIVESLKAAILPVNLVQVNAVPVDGTGSDSDPWGPV